MKRFLATAAAVLLISGISAGSASAKHKRQGIYTNTKSQGVTTGRSAPTGGNAALSGNNGNSGSGSNSLGNVKGGNSGGMR